MEQEVTLQRVSSIPKSTWKHSAKGESIYGGIVTELRRLPVKQAVQLKRSGIKSNSLYSSLARLLRDRKIKNIRLVQREGNLFAERMFE